MEPFDNNKTPGEMILFYESWYRNICEYFSSVSKQKTLLFAIIAYAFDGKREYPCEKLFLMQVYDQIDIQKAKHAIRSEAGKIGGKAGKGISRNAGNQHASKKSIANQKQNNSKSKANNIIQYKHNLIHACSVLEQDNANGSISYSTEQHSNSKDMYPLDEYGCAVVPENEEIDWDRVPGEDSDYVPIHKR